MEYLADILEMKPTDVRHFMKISPNFYSDDLLFGKRERLGSLYEKALQALENGEMRPVSFVDIEKQDVPIYEPIIDLCMKAVNKHGDCMTLVGMSLLLAVNEGVSTVEALQERLYTEISLQSHLDDLVKRKILSMKAVDGERVYGVGAVGGDIYHTIFKSRLSR